jgi:acyl-CoA reductase-like NAD-dependent aldehyde dehydrogenase
MSAAEHSVLTGTTVSAMDAALRQLHEQKDSWAQATASEQLRIVDEMRGDLTRVAERWVQLSTNRKGLKPGTLGEAEEWIFFSALLRSVRMLRDTLEELALGRPKPPIDRVTRVFPRDGWDRLLFPRVTGEVWTTADPAPPDPTIPGRVVLVLGAGNASPLAPIDVLHKLFVERCSVILKPNPVNDYLGPLIEDGFAALIRRGCFAIAYGGHEQGRYLSEHELVDELHITGSHRTYEAITFGSGPEGEARRAQNTPVNHRRFSAELGNISPVIIVPGRWSRRDINHQAAQVATWLTANAGFGCLTPRVLIMQKSWAQTSALSQFAPAASCEYSHPRSILSRCPATPGRVRRCVSSSPAARHTNAGTAAVDPH